MREDTIIAYAEREFGACFDALDVYKRQSLGYHGALLGAAALVLKVQQTEKGG